MKRLLPPVLMLLILMLSMCCAFAEEEGEIISGYFKKYKYYRPTMKASGQSEGILPAYTAVTGRKINEKWMEVTLEDGKTVYLHCDGILPLPEDTDEEDWEGWCNDSYNIWSLPFSKSSPIGHIESYETMTVLATNGEYSRVRTLGGVEGYIRTSRLRNRKMHPEDLENVRFLTREYTQTMRLMNGTWTGSVPEGEIAGSIEQSPFLDSAFSMLEADNPFLLRYRSLTGADVQSVFPLGVPYFWGGRDFSQVTERLPEYTTRTIWDGTNAYYEKGESYLYGLDCTGFVEVVCDQAGKPLQGELSEMASKKHCQAGEHIWCTDNPMPEDWMEVARGLEIGDIMRVRYGGRHVMIYMGTLRDYGYTEQNLPQLSKYLDHPLMIQSGGNPVCYRRFSRLVRSSSDSRTHQAKPSHGGVSVCIMGVEPADIPMWIQWNDETYGFFDVEGSCVTAFSMEYVTNYYFYRPGTPVIR